MAGTARKTNWFAIWVSVAVVVVLVAVGALVVWMNNAAVTPDPVVTPEAAIIDAETGAIAVGDGDQTMDTYIDFMCPVCNQFEQTYGEAIQGLVEDGTITLNIHPISILDRTSQGTEYSTRAANALYCVAESAPDAVTPFVASMYENQPAEGTAGLTDEQIIEIAVDAGAEDAAACITDRTYDRFVAAMTGDMPADENGGRGTPTLTVNGERIELTGDPQLDIVDRIG
jgi:protein-disulfide isomerase